MRFYPFGSSSLNPAYNVGAVVSASVSQYAASASYGTTVVSASLALTGIRGTDGLNGSCSYFAGPQGPTGSQGLQGPAGGISVALPSGLS